MKLSTPVLQLFCTESGKAAHHFKIILTIILLLTMDQLAVNSELVFSKVTIIKKKFAMISTDIKFDLGYF